MYWWNVSISTANDAEAEREFYVQAPDSKGAVMVAVGCIDLNIGTNLHTIHVGRPVSSPRRDDAFGWHRTKP